MAVNILLTGKPGVGKTTLIMRVVKDLEGISISGFYTQEIRSAGSRQGFQATTLEGRQATLAHIESRSSLRVSRYGVELEAFERYIVPSIDPALTQARLIVIDEIGRMECFSTPFREAVARALDSERAVLGTIGLRGGGFMAEIRKRADVELIEVTSQNREALVDELAGRLVELLA
jgi:nucleoside-triphosphatase